MGGFVQARGVDVIIENSSFIKNAFTGASFIDTVKVTALNSHFDDNVSSGTTTANSTLTAGFFVSAGTPASSADFFLKDCTFNRNFSEGLCFGADFRPTPGTAAGGSYESVTIEDCEFNDNTTNVVSDVFAGTGSQARPRANGLEFAGIINAPSLDNSGNCIIRRSQASRNIATQNPANTTQRALGAVGFSSFNIESITFEDCVASDNIGTSSNQGANFATTTGFAANRALGATFKRCVASNNQNVQGFGFGFTTGSNIGPGAGSQGNQVIFEDCIATNNLGVPLAAGTLPASPDSPVGAGFNIKSVNNCIVTNCIAEQNSIGIYVSEDTPNLNSNNIFSNNTLNGNLNFGVLDMSVYGAGTFYPAYYSNVAKQNGPTPDTTNYFSSNPALFSAAVICPAGCVPAATSTPIRRWVLPGGPCPVNSNCVAGDNLDNLSIRQ
jgi:hypothetical protein